MRKDNNKCIYFFLANLNLNTYIVLIQTLFTKLSELHVWGEITGPTGVFTCFRCVCTQNI